MPLELDPAWEYWEPSPEVMTALEDDQRCDGFDSIGIDWERYQDRRWNAGIRFGKGNPDKPKLHLGREKLGRVYNEIPEKNCPTCKNSFRGSHRGQIYCSGPCYPRPGRKREIADVACLQCTKMFRPTSRANRFCSRSCSARDQETSKLGKSIKLDYERMRSLFVRGVSTRIIYKVVGAANPSVCRRALIRMGVPMRPLGRPKSGRRGEMSSSVLSWRPVVGERIVLHVPDNPTLHLTLATVREITDWGCHLASPASGTGQFRALWDEMRPYRDEPLRPSVNGVHVVKRVVLIDVDSKPFTGDICAKCGGSNVRQTGKCKTCYDCGESVGGCT